MVFLSKKEQTSMGNSQKYSQNVGYAFIPHRASYFPKQGLLQWTRGIYLQQESVVFGSSSASHSTIAMYGSQLNLKQTRLLKSI